METNSNRKVLLYKSVSNTGSGNEDWRHNLYNILNNRQSEEGQLFDKSSLDHLNVDSRVDLLMANKPPQFKTKNSYGKPVEEFVKKLSDTKLGQVVEAVADVASAGVSVWSQLQDDYTGTSTSDTWAPWVSNIKAWNPKNTEGISFDYTFDFAMGQYGLWNAKEEVFLPTMNLIAPTLHQYISAGMIDGPLPNALNLIGNIIANTTKDIDTNHGVDFKKYGFDWNGKGNFLEKIMNNVSAGGKVLEALIMNAYNGFVYEVKFGNVLWFHRMMITDSKVEFSNEVDQYGFPVSGSVTLSFEGMIPMSLTSSTIDNMAARFGGGSL